MTKNEFIKAVSDNSEMTQQAVRSVLDGLERAVVHALANRDEITIPGIVKLSVVDKPARTARNPATGATVEVPQKRAVKTKVVKALSELVALSGLFK